MNKVYIFGAHSRAQTTAVYLIKTMGKLSIEGFLVDNDEKNEKEIDGIPVIDIRHKAELDIKCPVYIGTRGIYHDDVTKRLEKLGFTDIRPVTVELDTELRNIYFTWVFADEGRDFRKITEIDAKADHTEDISSCIYEVRSIYDKSLEKDTYVKRDYERPIQVGSALTDLRLSECEVRDDTGENISEKNRQLCEVTALYWMWKSAKEDYQGLVHYRRHFILPDDWTGRMAEADADILLPVPLYLGPSIGENYRFRHVSEDWDVLMEVLDDEAAEECFSKTTFFPCNMFVMKRDVLDDYCSRLFPVLFEVMERVGTHEDTYQNRYPAFMAERLLNLYCYKRRNDLKIIYADKNFLS